MIRSAGLVLFALILDILQAGVSAGLLALGSVGGPVGIPLALALGFAVNVCLSLTFGTLLVGLMYWSGLRSPWLLFSGFVGEIVPGFDNLPGWTLLVLAALWKDARKNKSASAKKGVLRLASAALPGAQMVMGRNNPATPTLARAGMPTRQTSTPQTGKDLVRTALVQRNFEGIKPYRPTPNVKTA
jgi:hypothetical protein